jgi:AraC-like DNA-binding protein
MRLSMSTLPAPPATGLRRLFDHVAAAGGEWHDGWLHLPPPLGTGALKLVPLGPGLLLSLHRYCLTEEIVVERTAEIQQPERLLFTFHAFDPVQPVAGYVSSAQLASTTIAYHTVLPAGVPLRLVAIAIDKALLLRWLGADPAAPPATLFADQQPRLVEALLTPELQATLQELTAPRPGHELDLLFYRFKAQELLYWLLRELSQRAGGYVRPLHAAEANQLLQGRATLLAAVTGPPPSLSQLAQAAGMSETKFKQLFRQVFGTSPYAYYQAARLREARHRLAHWSVAEVGHQLGFTNMGHFAHLFKRTYGLTPKRYQATLTLEMRA